MIITLIYDHKNEDGSRSPLSIEFEGTPSECQKAKEWPSYCLTEYGRNFIKRMAADQSLEAWEVFCCG
jgi:hypothetical protein